MSKQGLMLGAMGLAMTVGALSCGEVPTLDDGIAYISPIILPSPAVAIGDSLRDSLGVATPLRVEAFGRNDEQLPDPVATFLPTALPSSIAISEDGIVTASDTVSQVRTVLIVARVGSRLQTTQASLLIVPQPDSIGRTSPELVERALPTVDTLRVTVTGLTVAGTRVPVPGIIVRYRARVYGSHPDSATASLTAGAGAVPGSDLLSSVDTTDVSGASSRTLVVAGAGLDSVVVFARARSLRGTPLKGDSVHFVLRTP